MRVQPDGAEAIDLGTTETSPTIGITDYSRRVTDDFGVTTVVPRGFSRRMSLRFQLPTDQVDTVQRRLAALRATAATWVADDRFSWLSARGYFKDFQVDIPAPTVSYCTLTVEGLAENEDLADPGGDPAPEGEPSTFQLLQPDDVTDAVLTSTSASADVRPEWAPLTIYPAGAQVIRAGTNRAFESGTAGNLGNDPATDTTHWIDVGPTNRWAMFDQALGTTTMGDSQIVVVLTPASATSGLAVLDTDAGSIRVQAPGYDRTQLRGGEHGDPGAVLFLDLAVAAGSSITITISAAGGMTAPRTWNDAAAWVDAERWYDGNTAPGAGPVSVGTLLIGSVVALGSTEASPTAGITDYSRKDVDDFGQVTVVERAWAKRMTANALIRTDALDLVANRIAAVRARSSLWIGQDGLDSLTVYGFFKDFSIEVGENVSKLSLSIEGLSAAAKIEPLKVSVDWPEIGDPAGTKPADGATVGMTDAEAHSALINAANAELSRIRDRALSFPSPDGANIYTLHQREETARVEGETATAETFDLLGAVGRDGTAFVFGDNAVFAQRDGAGATSYVSVSAKFGQQSAAIEDVRQVLVGPGGAIARALVTLDVKGRAIGYRATNNGRAGAWTFVTDTFTIETPNGQELFYADDSGVKMHHVEVDTIKVDAVGTPQIAVGAVSGTGRVLPTASVSATSWTEVARYNLDLDYDADVDIFGNAQQSYPTSDAKDWGFRIKIDGSIVKEFPYGTSRRALTDILTIIRGGQPLSAGMHVISLEYISASADVQLKDVDLVANWRFV